MKAPVFFIGHGSPMNAIESNDFTKTLNAMRALYPNPKAVLCISAHWMTEGSWVTHMEKPKTIHDFYGFPQALFDVQYPAPGHPEIADLICNTIAVPKIHPDNEMWGLDHGTWSVLRHIFPDAEIPVLQLSMYMSHPAEYHYKLGTQLRQLRNQGILIVGSGNIVHNLRKLRWEPDAKPYEWAIEFDEWIKSRLVERDDRAVVESFLLTESRKLSVPTPDHYYPLLYVIGAADENEKPKFLFEEIHNSSISMRTMAFGTS